MSDKSKELAATVTLLNNRLHFEGTVEGNNPISIDYLPPLGDNLGYTSLELLLLSFSSCLGSAVLTFLRRMQKHIGGFTIKTLGLRNEDHPTGFKSIKVEIYLNSQDVTQSDFDKVIALAEDKYCPVWSMIKGNVLVDVECHINA